MSNYAQRVTNWGFTTIVAAGAGTITNILAANPGNRYRLYSVSAIKHNPSLAAVKIAYIRARVGNLGALECMYFGMGWGDTSGGYSAGDVGIPMAVNSGVAIEWLSDTANVDVWWSLIWSEEPA